MSDDDAPRFDTSLIDLASATELLQEIQSGSQVSELVSDTSRELETASEILTSLEV